MCSLLYRVIFEPWIFVEAYRLYQTKQLNWSALVKFIDTVIKYFAHQPGFDSLVLQLSVYCLPLAEVMREISTKTNLAFITRTPLTSIKALMKVCTRLVQRVVLTRVLDIFLPSQSMKNILSSKFCLFLRTFFSDYSNRNIERFT